MSAKSVAFLLTTVTVLFVGDAARAQDSKPAPIAPTQQTAIDKVSAIEKEMRERVAYFEKENLLIEAQRIYQRTIYDIEMMKEIGYCSGIENYSRHLSGRKPGSRPFCLIDFFPDDFSTQG